MYQHKLSTILVAAVAALALAACEDDKDEEASQRGNDSENPGATGGARPANPGVTATEVKIGMNAAFTGPSVGLGVEMWRGAIAAFQEANDKGGVHGRKVSLVLADDGYDSERAAPAILKLIEKENVFCTGWSVGTPTIVKTLPVIRRYHESEDFFHFGCFTGAQPQRNPPNRQAVFNVRASYRQETEAMVDAFVGMGLKKIGVFVQNDAYGTDGREGTVLALQKHGLQLVENGDQRYKRGDTYDKSYQSQMKALKDAGAEAIIMVGSYQACGGAIRDARKMGWDVPIHNVSFVGADQMLDFLKQDQGEVSNILNNLIITQVVPHYDDTELPAVQQYRAAMDKYNPQVPERSQGQGYAPSNKYSFGSFEGYLTGQVFLSVLENVGADLTRQRFIETAETGMGAPAQVAAAGAEGAVAGEAAEGEPEAGGAPAAAPAAPAGPPGTFDIGVGVPASFGPDDHQALDQVWFTYATEQGWRPADDIASVVKR